MNQNSVEDNDRKGLTPEGQIKIISIASEQTAPMADLATFAKALDAFCREDYYGDKPYDLLVRSSQFSWNQYDQFAAVLINAAHAAEVEDGVAEAAVKMYRDIFIEIAGDANDILSAIQAASADEEQKDRVSVLSIPCGSGKSTALTKLIYDVIRRNDSQGLIMKTFKKPKLKPKTFQSYVGYLHTHLYPAFGERFIEEIATQDIQQFMNERSHLA